MKRLVVFVLLVGMMAFLGGALAAGSEHGPNEHSGTHAQVPSTVPPVTPPAAGPGSTPAPNAHSTTTGNTDMGNQLCVLYATPGMTHKNPGMMMQYIRQHGITLKDGTTVGYENVVQWLKNFPNYDGNFGDWINRNCHGVAQ